MARNTLLVLTVCLLACAGISPARAQANPDAWTAYDLNLRAGPGGTQPVLAVLPPGTAVLVEARSADSVWLLVRTVDGARRGWVAAAYLEYAPGVVVARLLESSEIVGDAAPAGGDPAIPPSSTLVSQELIYDSGHSQYYRIVYWSDGLRVAGFLGRPSGDGPFPAIIYNRGGVWDRGALSGRELVPLVEAGYVAVGSQYRGNAGSEGAETFGSGDVSDVLNLIALVQQMPIVDPGRIGMFGASRGGMVTYMVLKEETLRGTHAIKAAATVGGLADLFMWRDDNPDVAYVAFAPVGAYPETAPDQFIARSAVFWPELINSPLLLLHGGADAIVSPQQSRALSERLQQAGKRVQLVIFEGDNHALEGQLGGLPPAMGWFQQFFGGDGTDRTFDAHWDNILAVNQWFWEHGYH
ncbi:MAG: prolyl oligopeptidase family serine peptidase [Anaerolineae bacterium]|nr:prolyl oligopeptidase family serine peptidase [Anaerolineae bacterium]